MLGRYVWRMSQILNNVTALNVLVSYYPYKTFCFQNYEIMLIGIKFSELLIRFINPFELFSSRNDYNQFGNYPLLCLSFLSRRVNELMNMHEISLPFFYHRCSFAVETCSFTKYDLRWKIFPRSCKGKFMNIHFVDWQSTVSQPIITMGSIQKPNLLIKLALK